MNEFNKGMAEILEVEPLAVNDDFPLGEAWDSLAVVSTIALVDDCFGVILEGEDLYGCVVIGDVVKLVDSKRKA